MCYKNRLFYKKEIFTTYLETPTLEIKKVIEDCTKGDRDAQKKLYEIFAPRMFAVCLQYTKNRTDAEDFLHEGFIKVFEKIGQFKHAGSFEGWIRRVMVNNILEEFRRNSKHRMLDETHLPPLTEENKTAPTSKETPKLQEIMSWINELPERYKMVFNLYVLEDMTHEEISKKMGISVGTSKSNLSRARQWLQKHIKSEAKANRENITLWEI